MFFFTGQMINVDAFQFVFKLYSALINNDTWLKWYLHLRVGVRSQIIRHLLPLVYITIWHIFCLQQFSGEREIN